MMRTGIFLALCAVGLATAPFLGLKPEGGDMVSVHIDNTVLAVAPYEVTVAQWQACVDDGACEAVAKPGDNAGSRPITGVNWFDVDGYISWANAKQGRYFRLPTVKEWRLISGKPEKLNGKPLFDDPRMAWAANYGQEETPGGPVRAQGSWSVSKNGIHDLEGNVWEWTASCNGSPTDATRCAAMHVMGAHDAVVSVFVRNPASGGCATGKPPTHIGFRLVEDLN